MRMRYPTRRSVPRAFIPLPIVRARHTFRGWLVRYRSIFQISYLAALPPIWSIMRTLFFCTTSATTIIFVMSSLGIKKKILFLGLFAAPPLLEIKDPFNSNLDETIQVLRQISTAVDAAGKDLLHPVAGRA